MNILNLLGLNGPEFELMALSQRAVEHVPFVPGQIRNLNIFEGEPISELVAGFEYDKGTISLIPNTPRGKTNYADRDYRALRYLAVPHYPYTDKVFADELMKKRPLPGQSKAQLAQAEIDRRMRRGFASIDATLEFQMSGALSGKILNSDGSVMYNLFSEFSVSEPSAIDFVLGTTTTSISSKCRAVCNQIEDAVGGMMPQGVIALCGATWFDAFISHPKVEQAYLYFASQNGMNPNRDDLRYAGFYFHGITFYQYRGTVSGQPFVPAAEAKAFPVGVPGLFKTFFAPANYIESVGTDGLPRYAKLVPAANNSFVDLEMQSNPLAICTIPEAVRRLTTS